ncbi:MAG: IS91 family transposase [Bacteroidales bacterium]|nr:IS91 family transposase [Bacteroidales bacterium]
MAGKRNKLELADVVRKFGKSLIARDNLSPGQTKALHNILRCRTASLGGHEEACDHCGTIRYSYNSCGDRHCPKCQGNKQALWIDDLQEATLPVKHYHIIFTVPHCLNEVCLWDQRMYYNILFSSVWRTLHSFGYTHYGVETGAVAVLHSWGQNLSLHPHIHCIVPAAGYSLRGEWKHIGKTGHYLYPVFQLSDTFRGKFLNSLKRKVNKTGMLEGFDKQVQKAWKTRWVVNSDASMAGAEHVIRYLGQYTHRVAISNHRILDMTDTHVTFIAKDYRDQAIRKPVTLDGVEFLRRFCLHVFPKRFVRIRRYGIYNPTTIRNLDLQFIPEKKPDIDQLANPVETTAERIRRLTGFDSGLCPVCKKGRMRVIRGIPRIRSPAAHLPTMLLSLLQ